MITITEEGRASVPGVGNIPIPNMVERAEALKTKNEVPYGISNIGSLIKLPSVDTRLGPTLARDNAWSGPRRERAYNDLLEGALLKLEPAIAKAQRFLKNTDYRDEVRNRRAGEALSEGWGLMSIGIANVLNDAEIEVKRADAIYAAAWTPDEGVDPMLQELRDQEIRSLFRGLDNAGRIKIVSEQAKLGNLPFFRILESDPLRMIVPSLPPEIWDRHKARALDSAGLGWVEALRQDAAEDAAHIKTVCELFKLSLEQELAQMPKAAPKPTVTMAA